MAQRKHKKRRKGRRRTEKKLVLDYYQPTFLLIQAELIKRGFSVRTPHPLRRSFWKLVPEREYDALEAREIVQSYLTRVEQQLAEILGHQSVGYWLHLYRRIAPGPPAERREVTSVTIGLVRASFEAAIQKYATFAQCDRIGFTDSVKPEAVLRGLLMTPDLQAFREAIRRNPQLVLTDFGVEEMQELYEAEKLAYEVWKAMAALRIIGKGAGLVVDDEDPYFHDTRSDELDRLVTNYDGRVQTPEASATATVFSALRGTPGPGFVILPSYNLDRLPATKLSGFFAALGLKLTPLLPEDAMTFNFLWSPYNLKSFYDAHRPFASGFESLHRIPLEWVVAALSALLLRVLYTWTKAPESTVHYWQRAYEGPYTRGYVADQIRRFLPVGIEALGLSVAPGEIEVDRVISFFELTEGKRKSINLGLGGPHFMLLPLNDDRVFIDYCWCAHTLYNLFYQVDIPDQNFKGDALEYLVHGGQSALPKTACRAVGRESRQVDAAFKVGETLVIVECRAVGRSFGVDRGDPQALQFRRRVVEKALDDIDEKGRWLSKNPLGTNYDLDGFRRILPIGVTPFAEFIPSTDGRYWLSDTLPRVMTPSELRDALESGVLDAIACTSPNAVEI